jgi:flagellar basal body-associated protein FliL
LDSRLDEREKKKKKKKSQRIYIFICVLCVIFKESVGVARIVHVETG